MSKDKMIDIPVKTKIQIVRDGYTVGQNGPSKITGRDPKK